MSAAHTPCFEDMDALTRIHGEFTDRVNDMAMAMQDESYTVGRQRGLADGKAQRDELLASLIETLAEGIGWYDNSTGGDTGELEWVRRARAAIWRATES